MLVASTSVFGFNCTTPAASSWRTPPSRPRASARSRASACRKSAPTESWRENLGFDRGHTCIQLSIVCFTISTSMNPSMTVRAKSNHMCRMIWSAIA